MLLVWVEGLGGMNYAMASVLISILLGSGLFSWACLHDRRLNHWASHQPKATMNLYGRVLPSHRFQLLAGQNYFRINPCKKLPSGGMCSSNFLPVGRVWGIDLVMNRVEGRERTAPELKRGHV
eukprot:2999088-Amphidinium_carterae.1